MKAKLTAKIDKIEQEADGNIRLSLSAKGVGYGQSTTSQITYLHGTLSLKSVIANEIKIGATITITLSDEESNEGA